MKIMQMSLEDRPREKMIEKGPGALSTSELLAIVLRTGTKDKNAIETARELMNLCENKLASLWSKSVEELTVLPGIGQTKAITVSAVMELCRRAYEEAAPSGEPVSTPLQVYNIMLPRLKGLDHEECWVLLLDKGNRCSFKERITSGSGFSTVFDTRQVIKRAIDKQACAMIIVHNHPGGSPIPSSADIEETRKLQYAVRPFNITLIDHVIVAGDSYYSFSEESSFDSDGRRIM